jgi:hypothetical protein
MKRIPSEPINRFLIPSINELFIRLKDYPHLKKIVYRNFKNFLPSASDTLNPAVIFTAPVR